MWQSLAIKGFHLLFSLNKEFLRPRKRLHQSGDRLGLEKASRCPDRFDRPLKNAIAHGYGLFLPVDRGSFHRLHFPYPEKFPQILG